MKKLGLPHCIWAWSSGRSGGGERAFPWTVDAVQARVCNKWQTQWHDAENAPRRGRARGGRQQPTREPTWCVGTVSM